VQNAAFLHVYSRGTWTDHLAVNGKERILSLPVLDKH
jgi:hypothetical protein